MVCRNLDVAQVVSRSSNLDCVTMEVRWCAHALLTFWLHMTGQMPPHADVFQTSRLPDRAKALSLTVQSLINIQGDQARRKGTLSGGWLDPNRSKLTASKGLKVCTGYQQGACGHGSSRAALSRYSNA